MIAMELNGSHVDLEVKLTYVKKGPQHPGKTGEVTETVRKITKLIHWSNGDVTVFASSWGELRYPYNAEVEFV